VSTLDHAVRASKPQERPLLGLACLHGRDLPALVPADPDRHQDRPWSHLRPNTGNFIDLGLGGVSTAAKTAVKSRICGPIPYAFRTGNFWPPYRELNRAIRELFTVIRECRSPPLFGLCLVTNPKPRQSRYLPRRRKRRRPAEPLGLAISACPARLSRGQRPASSLRSASATRDSGDANDRRSGPYDGKVGRVGAPPGCTELTADGDRGFASLPPRTKGKPDSPGPALCPTHLLFL
jgi:hypothetical protein